MTLPFFVALIFALLFALLGLALWRLYRYLNCERVRLGYPCRGRIGHDPKRSC